MSEIKIYPFEKSYFLYFMTHYWRQKCVTQKFHFLIFSPFWYYLSHAVKFSGLSQLEQLLYYFENERFFQFSKLWIPLATPLVVKIEKKLQVRISHLGLLLVQKWEKSLMSTSIGGTISFGLTRYHSWHNACHMSLYRFSKLLIPLQLSELRQEGLTGH